MGGPETGWSCSPPQLFGGAPEPLVQEPPPIASNFEIEDCDVGTLAELKDEQSHVHMSGVCRERLEGGAVFEFGDEAEIKVALDPDVDACP